LAIAKEKTLIKPNLHLLRPHPRHRRQRRKKLAPSATVGQPMRSPCCSNVFWSSENCSPKSAPPHPGSRLQAPARRHVHLSFPTLSPTSTNRITSGSSPFSASKRRPSAAASAWVAYPFFYADLQSTSPPRSPPPSRASITLGQPAAPVPHAAPHIPPRSASCAASPAIPARRAGSSPRAPRSPPRRPLPVFR
jgi:hypothetical protein